MLLIIGTSILIVWIAYKVHKYFYTDTIMTNGYRNYRRSSSLPNNRGLMGTFFSKCIGGDGGFWPIKQRSASICRDESKLYEESCSSLKKPTRVDSLTDRLDQVQLSSGDTRQPTPDDHLVGLYIYFILFNFIYL